VEGDPAVKIEIIGIGCSRCQETERRIRRVLAEETREAEVVHHTDPREMARRGLMLSPAVVIDGVLVLAGRIPALEEIRTRIRAAPQAPGSRGGETQTGGA
jgi:small redox-active disulfide protein 2